MSKATVCIVKVADAFITQKPLAQAAHRVNGASQTINHMVYVGDITAAEANFLLSPMPNGKVGFEENMAPSIIDFIDTMINEAYTPEQIKAELQKRFYEFNRMNSKNRARVARGEEALQPTKVTALVEKVINGHNRFVRDTMMYNAANGVKSTLSDFLGIVSHYFMGGQWGAIKDIAGTNGIARLAQLAIDPKEMPNAFLKKNDALLAAADIELPNAITQQVGAKTNKLGVNEDEPLLLTRLTQTNSRIVRTAASTAQSERVRSMRNGMELNGRGTLALAVYRDNQYQSLNRLMAYAKKNGIDPREMMNLAVESARNRTGLPRPETISVEDIRYAASQLSYSNNVVNNMARAWAQEQEWLINKAMSTNRELLFTDSRRLPGESILSKVFFFHYWMLRASALQAKKMLGNPVLTYNYIKMWNGAHREAERNGYPPTFVGMVKYWNNEAHGLFALMNPLGVVVPAMMFSDLFTALGDDRDFNFWEFANGILPMTPLMNASLAILGRTDAVVDPIGTRGNVEGVVRSIVQWGAANGFDFTMSGSKPIESITENVTSWVLESANNAAQKIGITDQDYEPYLTSMGRQDVVSSIALDLMVQEWGPTEDWTATQWEEARLSLNAIRVGSESTRFSQQAIEIYGDAVLSNEIRGRLIPGGSVLRFAPRDEDRILQDQGDSGADMRRTLATSSQGVIDIRVGEYQAEQIIQQTMGENYGFYESYNLIVDGFPDTNKYNATGYVKIGGQNITVAQLRAMTSVQRQTLADQWATERGAYPYIQEAKQIERSVISQNPNQAVANYKDFQNMVGDWGASIRSFRDWARLNSPSWAEAEAKARERFAARGSTGDVLESELDGWVFSVASYQAFKGQRNSIYDDRPQSAGMAPAATMNQQQGAGGEPMDTATRIRWELQNVPSSGSSIEALGPGASLWAGALGVQVNTPTLSNTTQQYLLWLQANPGKSPEEFVQWMISQGMSVDGIQQLPDYYSTP